MARPRYEETECKSVLNRVRGMGFAWSINPYKGCVHGCHYCFAGAITASSISTPATTSAGSSSCASMRRRCSAGSWQGVLEA